MATTTYTVEGSSTTKPENLPEGFTVREDTKLVRDLELMSPLGLTKTRFFAGRESIEVNVGNVIGGDTRTGFIRREDVPKLREFLDDNFPNTKQVGVIKDGDGDLWFELSPGKFTFAGYGGEKTYVDSVRRKESGTSSYIDKDRGYIREQFDITREYTHDVKNG